MIKSKALSERSESKGTFTVYILRTSANTLYIGQTNNLDKRIKEHESKNSKSAKYTRAFESFQLAEIIACTFSGTNFRYNMGYYLSPSERKARAFSKKYENHSRWREITQFKPRINSLKDTLF